MTTHVSASARQETSHVNRTTRTATIMNALTQRAQAALNDPSLDDRSRAILRHALEQNDPWLAELVRTADTGESTVETRDFSQSRDIEEDASRQRAEALAEIICGASGESAAALFVLMGLLQNCTHPEARANTLKHFAFTRCGEFNVFGMVDAQITVVEAELLSGIGKS